MPDKQPEPLKLADELEAACPLMANIVAMLRTQHAAIERKNALLRQTVIHLEAAALLVGSRALIEAAQAIKRELQQ